MTGRRLAVLLLLCAGTAACGGDGDPAADEPPVAALTASIARERLYEPQRAFELTLVNTTGAAIDVAAPRLVSDLYEPVPGEAARSVTVWPTGDPTSITLPYGAARCDDGDRAMVLDAVVDGARTELALGEAPSAILRVHAAECAAADVAAAVAIGWGDTWTSVAPGRVQGTVTIDLLDEAGVDAVVEEIAASVVFAVQVGAPMPAVDDVEVTITAARCDAHALTESKKTFTFPVYVSVDGGERVRIEHEAAGGPVRAALDRAIEECVAARTGH